MKRVMLPLLLLASLQAPAVRAEVKAGLGLGSRVNGVEGGSCKAGLCRIDGGSDSGRNRFHRLSRFDTRGAIRGVEIQSDGIRNLVLGVTAAEGSFIDKAVSLTSPAHLFLLSPGGIQLMPGGTFLQVPQLTLSTASQLRFAGGVFDVFNTPATEIPALGGDPLPGALGLLPGGLGEKHPWIRMDGVSIDVDEALLVDAPGGRVDVLNSRLSVSNSAGDGGSLTLTGNLVRVGEGAQLLATGSGKGGLVQVGGSWQNSDPTVRQATQTWMQQGSLVDASSTGAGDGGTVVIWSDLSNPSGGTVAQGTLLARGGVASGSGGRIETSGPFLVAEPERLDVSAANGLAGTWLLDPYDITIAAGAGAGDITPGASGGGRLFESSATNSRVNVTTISTELVGANVEIATGAGGAGGGNITWDAGAPIDYSSSANSLTLDAHGYIYLKSDIETGSGGLILEADSGYVQADGITLTLNGPLDIETGDTTIGTTGFASPQFAATLVGSQNLTKSGNGRLTLSGNSNTWSGTANVQGGTLRVSGNNALGTGTSTNVLSGATLEIDGGIIIGENIELRSGSTLLNWSGNNTITLPVLLRDNGSRVIEIRQGNLTLNPSAGNAISADNNVVADLTLAGSGDLLVQGIVDLDNGQVPATYGDLSQTGTGVARFKDSIIADQVESTGGGTIWMDQPGGLSVALPSTTSISLNNGSVLRRDSSETVTGINLSLGAGGGGISVGNGFTLDWNSAIAGAGTFTKAGDGTLRFASTANISYSGSTFVNGGRLDVFSSLPTTATCSGTGSSNLCGSTPTINSNSDVTGQENTPSERLIALDGLGVVPVLQLVKRDGSQVSDAFEGSSVPYAQVISGEASNGSKSIAVDFGTTSVEAVASSEAQAPTLATGPVQTVLPEQQAGLQLQGSDAQATLRAVAALGLDESLDGVVPGSPSVGNIQQTLVEVQQQAQSGLAFVPAVLRVNFTEAQSGFLDLTLVPPKGAVQARRIEVSRARFASLLKDLYRQLSRQELLDVGNPQSPSRQLHQLLIAPMQESLDAAGITTLLIAADQGLQAVPFSALSDGESYFGNRYGFALSPSLALTDLSASTQTRGLLAMGASEFETLSPLPLVPQELSNIRDSGNTDRYLNEGFTPRSFLDRAADPRYSRVHLASHADFRPGGPAKSLLYTGEGPMSMADFAQLRRQRRDLPLDLVVLSACRTMLGDKDSELGFAGLALQAGARSAIGTLWYVDDVVTSAFFVQFYRFLSQGVPKAEALQRTRQAFALGSVSLKGDQVIGAGGEALLQDLDQSQRRRIAAGVDNPFFWAGIELIGSPW